MSLSTFQFRQFVSRSVFALILAAGLVPPPGFAQTTSGTISGMALDSTGAAIPNASISVRSLDTNTTRNATTAADGRFSFRGLLVGRYELTVAAPGFAKYVRGPINLELNQEAVVNAELTPASLKETVVVTDDAPMLNTTTSEVGVRFDERRLADL
ncbi:MAG: carboxypeptidase-like regulatory domain-containing protein, partial [Candidatus Solibacter sp.]|nr:carboxypeptidase-like regulatory domain-containing protein [Candidatus Solibacter sp.]